MNCERDRLIEVSGIMISTTMVCYSSIFSVEFDEGVL